MPKFDRRALDRIPDLLEDQGEIHALAPGPAQTAMHDRPPALRKEGVLRSVCSGRVRSAAEVAAAILWLGTSCPKYVNGTTLDGNNGS